MGTSVLLPRDCLSPRSRHKHQFPEMIYREESAPQVRRNGFQSPPLRNMNYSFYSEYPKRNIVSTRFVVKERDSGILPLPPPGSLPINIPEVRNRKLMKKLEKRDVRINAKMLPDEPIITILQRPKNNNTVVAADVTMVQKPKHRSEAQAAKLMNKDDNEIFQQSSQGSKGNSTKLNQGDLEKRLNVSGFQKHTKSLLTKQNLQQSETNNCLASDAKNVSSQGAPQITARGDNINKQIVKFKANSNLVSNNWAPLRRTTTDPEMVNSVLNKSQNKSEVCISEKKHVESQCAIKNHTVASHERWAGPAYSSSPSPSSLPLPKFSRPVSRMSSSGLLPKDSKVVDVVVSASLSVSLPSISPVSHVDTWDVALATKSLKKMLNLDPI